MRKKEFVKMLNENPRLKKDLFIRGFLITDTVLEHLEKFPFYGNWEMKSSGGYHFYCHNKTGMYIYETEDEKTFFLMGHAYDPFLMLTDEMDILKSVSERYESDDYYERINEITGVYVLGCVVQGRIEYLVDPSGMQSACSGIINEHFYLSSHAQLVGDICKLKMDSFVKELIHYKWYNRVMGPYLPADLTPFTEVKRIIPSVYYQRRDRIIYHKRFWPLVNINMVDDEEDYQEIIEQAANILKRNMQLVVDKWNHPFISLTGGIDSNTTFSAANGLYDRLETFSYVSAEKELPDAEAAKKIAEHFGVNHTEFKIPTNNEELDLFEERRELFRHNNGYVAELYDNELRKKLFLHDNMSIDVEVKSWVSETIRAYWYKHYGRKSFPKLSGKLYRNLYKIFLLNRGLAHKIDALFDTYIKEYEYDKIPEEYPAADMHYNEVTWGSWGGLNISEMKYCYDITFIYNNRKFLDLLFRVPLDKRISDRHHLDMKKYLNSDLSDMGIRVINLKETNFRAFALNMIFTINSILPF